MDQQVLKIKFTHLICNLTVKILRNTGCYLSSDLNVNVEYEQLQPRALTISVISFFQELVSCHTLVWAVIAQPTASFCCTLLHVLWCRHPITGISSDKHHPSGVIYVNIKEAVIAVSGSILISTQPGGITSKNSRHSYETCLHFLSWWK